LIDLRTADFLEIAALFGDLVDRLALGDPAKNLLLVLLDLFGTEKDIVGNVTRHDDHTINVTEHDIAGLDDDIADLDWNLIVGNEAAAE
jgi:hypothetical protein